VNSGDTDANGGTSTGGSAGADATEHVCPGDYPIQDEDSIAAIVDCTTITGNLIVSNTTLTSLSLPNLIQVDGFFNCQVNGALTSVSLPALTTIGHVAFTGNEQLTSLNLPNLATANGMTLFVDKLTSLSLPKLVSILNELDFEVLGNTPLTSLSLPELATVTDFTVRGTLLLTDLALPKLATVDGFRVDENAALTSLTAPALATVQTNFRVVANPMLPTCQVQALLQQLTNFSGMTYIDGNNDAGICE
jgi:hypothetical protein